MSLWEEANELEHISNQISCLGNVLEMVAEKIPSDPESGTLWLCSDVCSNLFERLQLRVEALLAMHVGDKKAKK
jgi:hypothetical protein